jgi:tRNA threonylcarbamoyladenosine biosynthesis protein TsaB
LGVGTGPGNFTGLRIAVAAARGLALGLGVPAIGVTGCAARQSLAGTDLPAIPAPRGQVWLCDGSEIPALMTEAEATNRAAAGGQTLKTQAAPDALAVAVARIAAERRHERLPPPAPLYARPADAAPARDLPPLLLD